MATFLAPLALAAAAVAHSVAPPDTGGACADVDEKGVTALFDQWNLALSSLDAAAVADRYWPDAVLLGSSSNAPRTSSTAIRDYFSRFLGLRPRGRVDSRTVHIGCNLAIDSGTYAFSLMSESGAVSELSERYTFVYQYRNGAWKILHHHESSVPDAPVSAPSAALADARPAGGEAASTRPLVAAGGKPRAKHGEKAGPKAPEDDPSRASSSVMFLNRGASPEFVEFYPKTARAAGEHGSVAIRVCADPKGRLAGPAEVLRTSGFKSLDAAAVDWAKAAKWVPATANGNAVEGCAQLTVEFGA